MITEADLTRWRYNCLDTIYTYKIARVEKEVLAEQPAKLQEFNEFQQKELAPALVRIMNRGIRVNLEKKEELHAALSKLLKEVEGKIDFIIGEHWNTKSNPQNKKIFLDLLAIKPKVNKKSGNATFGTEAMWSYLEEYPLYRVLLTLVLESRSIGVFLRTFLSAKVDDDGRMRSSYNVAGTKTYRLASRKNGFGNGMNLQNVPAKGKIDLKYAMMPIEETDEGEEVVLDGEYEGITELPNCKELFIPDPDWTFFDIDYSSADARVVAYDSDCRFLIDIFNSGDGELYAVVASEYYHKTILKSDNARQVFKAICHGTHYLGKAAKLAAQTGLLVHEVDKVQKWYFKACPEILQWHKAIIRQVEQRGYIENVFGARGWFLDKTDHNLYNKAVAWVPQSTIGILVNKGLVNIDKKEDPNKVQVLMQTHDSLSGQFLTSDLEAPSRIVKHMEIELKYNKPLIIPAGIKTSTISYGHCK